MMIAIRADRENRQSLLLTTSAVGGGRDGTGEMHRRNVRAATMRDDASNVCVCTIVGL